MSSVRLKYQISGYKLISGGFKHSVGVKTDGTVISVGDNSDGQCSLTNWNKIASITAGYYHTVGLKSDGTVGAEGRNSDGQCSVSDWNDIVAVAAGGYHTVAVKANGSVFAWGYNNYGQLGIGNTTDQTTPQAVIAVPIDPNEKVILAAVGGFSYSSGKSGWECASLGKE